MTTKKHTSASDALREKLKESLNQQLGGEKAEPKQEAPPPPPTVWFESDSTDDNADLLTYAEFTNGEGSVPDGIEDTRIFRRYDKSDWDKSVHSMIPDPMPGFRYTEQVYYMFLGAVNKLNIFAVGGAGTGKDTAAKQFAALSGMPYRRITGMQGVTPDMILGKIGLNEAGTTWEDGDAALWARFGGMMVISEPATMPPDTMFAFQSALEDCGHLSLMDHPDPEQRMLDLHDECRIVLTSNVRGTGAGSNDHKFGATGAMDESTRNRMEQWIHFKYMDAATEGKVIKDKFPVLGDTLVSKMVQFGNLLRTAYDQGQVESSWSLRNAIPWCKMTVKLRDPAAAFRATFFDALEEDEQQTVREFWNDVDFESYKL